MPRWYPVFTILEIPKPLFQWWWFCIQELVNGWLIPQQRVPRNVVWNWLARSVRFLFLKLYSQRTKMTSSKYPWFWQSSVKVAGFIHKNAKFWQMLNLVISLRVILWQLTKMTKNIRPSWYIVVLQRTFPCNRSRCFTCLIFAKNDVIWTLGHDAPQRFNCASTKVVYAIMWTRFFGVYIGETGRRFGDRVREHLRNIRKNALTSDVATHSNALNHDINVYSVMVITSIVECQRKLTEAKLIQKLGLNRADDSSHRTR